MKATRGSPRGRGVTPYGLIATAGVGTAGYRLATRTPNGPRGLGHVAGYARGRGCTPAPNAYKGTGGRGLYGNRHTSGPAADVRLPHGPYPEAPYSPARTAGRRTARRMSPPTSAGVACAGDLRLMSVRGRDGGSRESADGDTRLGHADTRHEPAASESRPIERYSSPARGPQGPQSR